MTLLYGYSLSCLYRKHEFILQAGCVVFAHVLLNVELSEEHLPLLIHV